MVLFVVLGRLDQPVAVALALIHHADIIRLRIAEHEEAVPQHVHLQDGLLHAHRLDRETLGFHHAVVLVRNRRVVVLRGEGVGAQPLLELGLVLDDLPHQQVHHRLEGIQAVVGGLLRAEIHARRAHGDLNRLPAPFVGHGDDGLGGLVKKSIQLGELFLHTLLKRIFYGCFAGFDGDVHIHSPFTDSLRRYEFRQNS